MESRKIVVWSLVGVLMAAAVGLVVFAFVESQEPALTSLMQDADQVVVVTPKENLELKPSKDFQATVNEVFRGTLKPKASIRVFTPQNGPLPKLARGGKYVLLLKKSDRASGYELLGRQALLLSDQTVRHLLSGQTQAEWSVEDFRRLLAQNGLKRPAESRETLTGRWMVVITFGVEEYTPLLLEFAGGNEVRIVENQMTTTVLKSAKATPDSLEMVLTGEDFQQIKLWGELQDGKFRGALLRGDVNLFPLRMEPTRFESLGSIEITAPGEGAVAIRPLIADGERAPLEDWMKSHPDSPVGLAARFALLSILIRDKADRQTLQKFAEEYIQFAGGWDPLLATQAQVNVGVSLVRNNAHPELAMSLLESVKDDASLPGWKGMVKRARGELLVKQGKDAQGLALFQEVLKESPLDVETMVALAQYYESHKMLDEAIEAYADILVIPGIPEASMAVLDPKGKEYRTRNPRAVAERLWTEKHKDLEGFIPYLDSRYEARVPPVRPERTAPRPADPANRVALLELFTGTSCGPCVASDLAAESLTMAFAPSELIVLQYHLNVPAVDPLSNEASAARFTEVAGQGTPLMLLNGHSVSNPGGPFASMSEPLYSRVRASVEKALKEKAPVRISLKARSVGSKVTITADVQSSDALFDDLRLRVGLAEEQVDYFAPNGIRKHYNVLRYSATPPAGLPPRDGKLALSQTVDLKVLRDRIGLAQTNLQDESGVELPEILDFKSFQIVAFVTDGSGDVLQAAAVPVAGLPQ